MSQLTLFSEETEKGLLQRTFESSDLGQFYKSIPFDKLEALFPSKKNIGIKGLMTVRGGLALQFLKAYLDLSDTKLIERVNTDWSLQMFCGVNFGLHTKIKDKDYVGRWRRWLAKYLNIDMIQSVLISFWKEDLKDKQSCLMDATCYESHVRYPTDVKLLWECCEWVFENMFKACKSLKVRRPRSKYKEKKLQYSSYSKKRKKTYKVTKKMRKQLIFLLEKGLNQLYKVLGEGFGKIEISLKFHQRWEIIKVVLEQQKELYENGETAGCDRIISLAKPYLRPIVRGKETKRVEFGVKAHMMEIGGICLIEHLSFNAFNESTRLKSTVRLHEKYVGQVRMIGADAIYATRANREWCKVNGIVTSFVPLGRPKNEGKKTDVKVARKVLNKERSTVLEGSFGNQKLHYGLGKIRAKTKETEILWIAFGVWAAAAMKMARIRAQKESPPNQVVSKAA